jgi:chorismate mutase
VNGEKDIMGETAKYFVVRRKAVPEVLLKVVEAKRLLESEKVPTIQEAVDAVGISRSSFYKYKDDIFQFHDNLQGSTFTLIFQMDDEPGLLSDVLKIIADCRANILTIHQSIPINGIASLSLSVQILKDTVDITGMVELMENQKGVRHVKILSRE